MIKLSVIIPIENNNCHLSRTLESIIKIGLEELEVLCVINSSCSDAMDTVSEYCKKDSRIRIIPFEGNHAQTYNIGIMNSVGTYIHFLLPGDILFEYAYESIIAKAEKYDAEVIRFSSIEFKDQITNTIRNNQLTMSGISAGLTNRVISKEYLDSLLILSKDEWTSIYKREFIDNNNIVFPDEVDEPDKYFYYSVISRADRIILTTDKVVLHAIDSKNVALPSVDRETKSLVQLNSYIKTLPFDYTQLPSIINQETDRIISLCSRNCAEPRDYVLNKVLDTLYSLQYSFLRSKIVRVKEQIRRLNNNEEMPDPDETTKEEIQPLFHKKIASPKVSVIVPIMNQEDYLNTALDSLIFQTLTDLEIICVNDGSTDSSLTILKQYAGFDERIVIIDKPNSGYGHSMNVGIDAAIGEYIGILEPDDYASTDMFKDLYEVAHANNLDFVKANFNRFWISADGSIKRKPERLSNDGSYYNRVVDTSNDINTFRFVMNTWSGIYKRIFLNNWHIRHNETPGASYQDNGFWFQTFMRANRAWFVDNYYYMNRRDNPNSSMFSKGKFYAVTNEYKYIWDIIKSDPKLISKYEKIFQAKRVANFITTYHRIDSSLKQDYLLHMQEEFKAALADGKLDHDLIGETNWRLITAIVENPEKFYSRIRVSVIIPAYNVEKYISECLDSILVRDEVRMEVIVVDDGSTDGTLEILKEYEAKDARVTVISQKNAGAGAARNLGLKYAKGEYLAFLDADDFFDPEMLRVAYSRADLDDSDIVVVGCDQFIDSTKEFQPLDYSIKTQLLPPIQPFAGTDVREDVYGLFVGWPWDKLFRRDFVIKNSLQFQEQRTTNDAYFVFSALVKADRISVMNSVLAHHRRLDKGGSLSVSREKSWDCFYHALIKIRNQLYEWDLYDRFERDFINYSLHFAIWNLHTLRGPAFHKLYNMLKGEWFSELQILNHDRWYFYNQSEYDILLMILDKESEEYLFDHIDAMTNEVTLLRQTKNNLSNDKRNLNNRIKTLEKHKYDIKNSVSFKVGRAITYAPRRIRRLLGGK